MLLALAAAWLWDQRRTDRAFSPIQQLGRTSLFIYWVHVELVYGVSATSLKGSLSLGQTVIAYVVFTLLLLAASLIKDWVVRQWRELRAPRAPGAPAPRGASL